MKFLHLALALLPSVLAAPTVQLGNTTLTGRQIPTFGQEFFGGIPFTEPPVGRLRLRPPILRTRLNVTTFDASNFGLACLQEGVSAEQSSEDCLTINVLRPAGIPANASLPVMAWVYGGGFEAGTASIYNASFIVAQSVIRGTPIVYVNFNYRLGPLGFPQGQEADDRGALNLALRDQLAALEWIQANIGLFGGDKNKVTVFGESAGAITLSILFLNSPLNHLARAAILESGSQATALTFNAAHREGNWENFVKAIPQCAPTAGTKHTFDCLQSVNSSVLLPAIIKANSQANEQFPWDPTIDGPGGLMPEFPSLLLRRGQFARLPFISGTNLDEGTDFTPTTVSSEAEIRNSIIANLTPSVLGPAALNNAANRLLQLYPDDPSLGSPFNTGNETFGLSSSYKRAAAIQGDVSFQSQRRLWQQTASKAGVKTFGYLFTDPQPTLPPAAGVAHGSEVFYVYGALLLTGGTPSAIKLSVTMIDYWLSFATSLDPNDGRGTPRPHWDQYTPTHQAVIQLNGNNLTMIPDDYRKEQIDFINSQPLVFHHRRSYSEGT